MNFIIFDEKTGVATVKEKDQTLEIKKEEGILYFIEDGKVVEQVKDIIVLNEESILEQFETQIPKLKALQSSDSLNND